MLLDIENKIEEENQQINSAGVNKRKKKLIDVDKRTENLSRSQL